MHMTHHTIMRSLLPAAMLVCGLLVTMYGVRPAAAQPSVSVFTVNSTADDSDLEPGMASARPMLGDSARCAPRSRKRTPHPTAPAARTRSASISLAAGVQVISPAFALADISDPVVIDGYTQPGAQPNTLAQGTNAVLLIELKGDGASFANGLTLRTSDSTVRGLVINGFFTGWHCLVWGRQYLGRQFHRHGSNGSHRPGQWRPRDRSWTTARLRQ